MKSFFVAIKKLFHLWITVESVLDRIEKIECRQVEQDVKLDDIHELLLQECELYRRAIRT